MAWDSSRPVPWEQLTRQWLVYVAIMGAIFVLFFRDRELIGIFAGLLASGPLYLAFGYVLAKLGYQRRTWKEMRAEARTERAPADTDTAARAPRAKPAPTRRTGGGSQRPGGSRKRRR